MVPWPSPTGERVIDSKCYHQAMDIEGLSQAARESEELARRSRRVLVSAVRSASREGMTQREIATAIGRSQPEVHRLLHFHGDSPAGVRLRRARGEVQSVLASAGMSHPRVFGSVARGEDREGSDLDLMVTANESVGLMALARIEAELGQILGMKVDLVLDDAIRADLEEEILESAVPL